MVCLMANFGTEIVCYKDKTGFCLQHHDHFIHVWHYREECTLPVCIRHHHSSPSFGRVWYRVSLDAHLGHFLFILAALQTLAVIECRRNTVSLPSSYFRVLVLAEHLGCLLLENKYSAPASLSSSLLSLHILFAHHAHPPFIHTCILFGIACLLVHFYFYSLSIEGATLVCIIS